MKRGCKAADLLEFPSQILHFNFGLIGLGKLSLCFAEYEYHQESASIARTRILVLNQLLLLLCMVAFQPF